MHHQNSKHPLSRVNVVGRIEVDQFTNWSTNSTDKEYKDVYQEWGWWILQGVPKKMWFKPIFEFLTLGVVFSGVKNNSNNFGNKIKKKWRKMDFIRSKLQKLLWFYEFMAKFGMENFFKWHKSQYLCICK